MKIVVQCSGGVESTTLIAKALVENGRENVHLVAFDDGSLSAHFKDRFAIKQVVNYFQLQEQFFLCNIPQVDRLEYTPDKDFPDVGFIPGYKMLVNTASLAYAQRLKAERVWIGNMKDNVYQDESNGFLCELENLYTKTYYPTPLIFFDTPFSFMSKADVLKVARDLEILPLIYDTVSCGNERVPGGYNCGMCDWCLKRRAAFQDAGIEDKTVYTLI